MRLCLLGLFYCEAKIALSNSLAVLGVFSLAYNRGKHGAFMHLFLSLFCPPELHCFAHLIYIAPTALLLALHCEAGNRAATCCPLFCTVHCAATVHTAPESVYKVACTAH